jgi:hypothetical protein
MNFLTIRRQAAGSRPYGQPGQKPKLATLLPYWLGIIAHLKKADCAVRITLVNQSIRVVKVIPCYIDSALKQ